MMVDGWMPRRWPYDTAHGEALARSAIRMAGRGRTKRAPRSVGHRKLPALVGAPLCFINLAGRSAVVGAGRSVRGRERRTGGRRAAAQIRLTAAPRVSRSIVVVVVVVARRPRRPSSSTAAVDHSATMAVDNRRCLCSFERLRSQRRLRLLSPFSCQTHSITMWRREADKRALASETGAEREDGRIFLISTVVRFFAMAKAEIWTSID